MKTNAHLLAILCLIPECHATSVEHGWWDDQKAADGSGLDPEKVVETVPEKVALLHSEVSEALEDYRVGKIETVIADNGKPTGFYSELADVAIRLFDLLGAMGLEGEMMQLATDNDEVRWEPVASTGKIPSDLAFLHAAITDLLMAGDFGDTPDLADASMDLLVKIDRFFTADEHKGERGLVEEMRLKMTFNKGRPYRHGNKAC